MKRSVLDSYAILSFLFQEKGHEKVLALFEWAADNNQTHLISTVNWAEVRYIVERKSGPNEWSLVRGKLLGLPIEIVDVDQDLAESAGEFKAHNKISLGDSFAAALAKLKKLEICTGDPEFRHLEGGIKINWL